MIECRCLPDRNSHKRVEIRLPLSARVGYRRPSSWRGSLPVWPRSFMCGQQDSLVSCRGSCQRWQWSARQHWSGGDYPATLSGWFAVGASVSLFGQLLGSLTLDTASRGARSLALMNLFAQLFSLISTICFAHLFGLFPDGRIYRRFERHILRGRLVAPARSRLFASRHPVVPLPDYFPTAPIDNPFHLLNIDLDGDRHTA